MDPFLISLGWNDFFQASFEKDAEPGLTPGRIIGQGRGHYHVQVGPQDILEASITNRLRHAAKVASDFPGVGDWVTIARGQGSQKASIHSILKRKSLIQRKRAGTLQETQLIVTNVDFVIVATSPNEDFDLDRLGRYLALSKDSGATPILLITKSDLSSNPGEYIKRLKKEFGDVDVYAISNKDSSTIDELQKFFKPGMTTVLLGSSGVGKSTLTNYLLGLEAQKTQTLSGDIRGRHTTTARNLLVTRWGGLVIDTPGMQDITTIDSEEGTQKEFPDIEELVLQCKFTNCRHKSDPGCAISGAIKDGKLTEERWDDYIRDLSKSSRPSKKK